MSITLNGTTGITTPASTVGGSAVLTTASTIAASALPAGSVLQVVKATTNTITNTLSTSFVATSVTVTITPTSATSKILILHNGNINSLGSGVWAFYTLYRGGTNLYTSGSQGAIGGVYGNGTSDIHVPSSIVYLDSPATTAAVTYTVYLKSNNGGTTVRYNADGWHTTINALEIAG